MFMAEEHIVFVPSPSLQIECVVPARSFLEVGIGNLTFRGANFSGGQRGSEKHNIREGLENFIPAKHQVRPALASRLQKYRTFPISANVSSMAAVRFEPSKGLTIVKSR